MRRLLHVENDPLVARAVKRLLRVHQYEVGSVLSYAEGRALQGNFHVGILDVDLGDGDGVELARQLLAQGVLDKVVFFTARTDAETTARASALGAVVSKTAGTDALLDEIANCFKPQSQVSQTRNRTADAEPQSDLPSSSSRSA